MSCILANGISLGCKDSLGGIKEVYIASFNNAEAFTYDADGVIDGASGTADFYTFEMRQEQGQFVQNGNHSIENGTNFWSQEVSLVFTKNDATDRNTLLVLAQSTLLVIVKDQNGSYWLVGEKNGAELTASSQSSGKAYGDMNGTTLTITGKEASPARRIDETALGADFTIN